MELPELLLLNAGLSTLAAVTGSGCGSAGWRGSVEDGRRGEERVSSCGCCGRLIEARGMGVRSGDFERCAGQTLMESVQECWLE
jgi:hypothetical protein